MKYYDDYLSIDTGDFINISKVASGDDLQWSFTLKDNDYCKIMSLRIISRERIPLQLKHINMYDATVQKQKIDFEYGLDFIGVMNIEADIARIYIKDHPTLCFVLIDAIRYAIRLKLLLQNDTTLNAVYNILKTVRINSLKVVTELNNRQTQCADIIEEYVVFFAALLHWPREYTLMVLENISYNFRDDIEYPNSWFYHEVTLYDAIHMFLRVLSVQNPYEIDIMEIINIVLAGNTSCTHNTEKDWNNVRKELIKILDLPDNALDNFIEYK